jgi:IclR family transcriptional regulator, KDG regulon repressor
VQSLGRAFAILEEVARDRHGIGLAELSKRLGLHSSTTFHLAKTLVSLGYIRQEPGSKRYRIAGALFALAASALDEIEMVNLPSLCWKSCRSGPARAATFPYRWATAWW